MSVKALVKSLANAMGFTAYRYGVRSSVVSAGIQFAPKISKNFKHAPVIPTATYSPWLEEADFLSWYKRIKNNTLVDEMRCYELWALVQQTLYLPGDILEVGVWRGGTGTLIAAAAARHGSEKTVYLADTFTGVVKSGPEDSAYSDGEHHDTSLALVQSLLERNRINNTRILEGVFPDKFPDIAGQQFCFVHIDVDVLRSAEEILNVVWSRMPSGGIVVFDDYGFASCDGITALVNRQMQDHDKRVLHNLNGHAIYVKI